VNLLAHHKDQRWLVMVFPRAQHRPACYFVEGASQLLVSPAILEMCGILVTTEHEHYERLDAPTARTIYQEVSIDSLKFQKLAQNLEDGA
jgi:hypothetical protein